MRKATEYNFIVGARLSFFGYDNGEDLTLGIFSRDTAPILSSMSCDTCHYTLEGKAALESVLPLCALPLCIPSKLSI